MSVVLQSSGGGSITLQEPATASNRTLSLPDATGTVALTSDIPSAGGMTLLGTITTTSGNTNSLSSLTLTGYRKLYLVFNGVVITVTSGNNTMSVGGSQVALSTSSSSTFNGHMDIDLTVGTYISFLTVSATGTSNPSTSTAGSAFSLYAGRTTLTTASTSISAVNGGTGAAFNGGSIAVYGVK